MSFLAIAFERELLALFTRAHASRISTCAALFPQCAGAQHVTLTAAGWSEGGKL